jgi:hypothetical protein
MDMNKLIRTLTNAAQVFDDAELRLGDNTFTEWGKSVRKEIGECLSELYNEEAIVVRCNHWPGQPHCGVCGMGM